jgi:hypothetical protein
MPSSKINATLKHMNLKTCKYTISGKIHYLQVNHYTKQLEQVE